MYIFLQVGRLGSITQAAEELNMAQPAVSYAIRELESYYETKLFERMNRRLYITEPGEKLMSYASSILDQFDEAKNVLKDVNTVTKIRIGANVSYGINKLPKMLAGFHRKHPEIPIYTQVHNSARIEEELLRNGLDFGVIDCPVKSDIFFYQLLESDMMMIVCASGFEVPENMQIRDLGGMPLLLREDGSGLRNIMDSVFENMEAEGIRPNIVMESTDMQSLIEACICGLGLLVLPQSVVAPYLQTEVLKEVRIKGINLTRQYYLVYHKSKFMTKSMKLFKKYIGESLCEG